MSSPETMPHCVCASPHGPERMCGDEHDGWACTRPVGHDGAHVACGGDYHHMARWDA